MSKLGQDLIRAAEEAVAHARGQTKAARETVVAITIPSTVDVAGIRRKLGVSQQGFALQFGFSVKSVRNWEQGTRRPEGPARTLLLLIDRNPEMVQRTLTAV